MLTTTWSKTPICPRSLGNGLGLLAVKIYLIEVGLVTFHISDTPESQVWGKTLSPTRGTQLDSRCPKRREKQLFGIINSHFMREIGSNGSRQLYVSDSRLIPGLGIADLLSTNLEMLRALLQTVS